MKINTKIQTEKHKIVTVLFLIVTNFILVHNLFSQAPTQATRKAVLQQIAKMERNDYNTLTALFYTTPDSSRELAFRRLDSLLNAPKGDMFWMFANAGFYFNSKKWLDEKTKFRFRELWKNYTPYKGDTENHFLMYYGSLLLFSQEWQEPHTEWFNGKSSQENYDEAKEYLLHWVDEISKYGITEWDSPRYIYYYITPLILLYDFTQDRFLKKKFQMVLELLLLDFALDYLKGNYCGAHSRDGDNSVIDPRKAEATSYAGLYFEDSVSLVLPDLAFAALSEFQLPQIIRNIALDRSKDYVNIEQKFSRRIIRFSDKQYERIFRYNYMTPHYCLGSAADENNMAKIVQPIQQHSFDITFASKKNNNTIFSIHPSASSTELGMFFPEEPELMEQSISKSKASYGSENKWIGGSFYEKIYQNKNTLIVTYNLSSQPRYPHSDLFIGKSADTIIRSNSGWVFVKYDSAFVAIYPFDQKYEFIEEEKNFRLRSKSKVNGYIFECSDERIINFNLFKKIFETKKIKQCLTHRNGFANYRNYKGDNISINLQTADFFIKKGEIPKPKNYLFLSKYAVSQLGSGLIKLMYNKSVRTLDFKNNNFEQQ